MRVLLVDDEPLASIELQGALEREVSGIQIVAAYSNPTKVIAGVLEHRPDVVFLDIGMPEIDGLELGRQIQAVVPGIYIVFVTGYDQYAVRAFELYALDYLVKPVNDSRLRNTVMRIQEKLNLKGLRKVPVRNAPLIGCFEQILFHPPGMEAQTVKWRTSKSQELFAFLLYHRERVVGRGVLLELLWPNIEEARAAQHLYTAIYHIRQTLKSYKMDSISIRIGELQAGYQLDIGGVQVDTELWESELKQLGSLDVGTADAYERVLRMYTGHYLGDYDYLWVEHERERLQLLWLYQMKRLSEYYEGQCVLDKAIQINLDIQRICPDEEECYFSLMKLYHAVDNHMGIEEQYYLLKTRMESELELPISENIVRWYEQWRLGQHKLIGELKGNSTLLSK
ncbi:response regulator [Paenibacillus sp. NPDC058910]|uniref:response regulator n=1 Tax=unclassified Paenibacillus TaxID=185978 RepID=UPI0036777DDC